MKKIMIIVLTILNLSLYIPAIAKEKNMVLNDKIIFLDAGHGGVDKGTSYENIYEKDINLAITLKLKEELSNIGAKVILTREGDYDLSTPNATLRKRSDFDNRIKLINSYDTYLFISIHQNYYSDSSYGGAQVFYKGNKELGTLMQEKLNNKRKIKKIDDGLYMYNKLKSDGLLIECGFLSNATDRNNLTKETYQLEFVKKIKDTIVEYIKK